MGKKSLITTLLAIIVAIFIAELFAQIHFWYYKIWWFDIVMHTLGGLFIGLLSLYLYFFSRRGCEETTYKFVILLAVLSATFIGVGWEFFEFLLERVGESITGVPSPLPLSLPDTLADLFFDMTGGLIGAIIFSLLWRTKKQ